MLRGIFIALFGLLIFSCETNNQGKNDQVLNPSDYDVYLASDTKKEVTKAQKEFDFWDTKWQATQNQSTYLSKMAAAQNALFKSTGDIDHLSKATEYLEQANELNHEMSAGSLRSLARNYITEHRFKKALVCLDKALEIGSERQATYHMLYDVHMELANDELAYSYLQKVKDKANFDYIVREAKWQDHVGDLDQTIFLMNKALRAVEQRSNKDLIKWTTTNLADYYGHNGEIQRSYDFYIKALELDPSDAYSKKGLAWIAFSHEKDVDEANKILDSINTYYDMPDLTLLRADIAEYVGDTKKRDQYLSEYFTQMEDLGAQAHMYNKYSAMLYADKDDSRSKAIEIAQDEIDLRPTSQSYSLLAYAYLQGGDLEKATQIVNDNILDKTSEPEPLLIAAMVLKENDIDHEKDERYLALKSALMDSSYELGPTQAEVIRKL